MLRYDIPCYARLWYAMESKAKHNKTTWNKSQQTANSIPPAKQSLQPTNQTETPRSRDSKDTGKPRFRGQDAGEPGIPGRAEETGTPLTNKKSISKLLARKETITGMTRVGGNTPIALHKWTRHDPD